MDTDKNLGSRNSIRCRHVVSAQAIFMHGVASIRSVCSLEALHHVVVRFPLGAGRGVYPN